MNSEHPLQRNRARELAERAYAHYKQLKTKLTKKQSINLTCTVGVKEFDVYSMGDYNNDFICVHSIDAAGTAHFVISPVEQIAFRTSIYNFPPKTPSREIGFHAIEAQRQKSAV